MQPDEEDDMVVSECYLLCTANLYMCKLIHLAGRNVVFCQVCGASYCSVPCMDWDAEMHFNSPKCKRLQLLEIRNKQRKKPF